MYYTIHKDNRGEYYWLLRAANHETIARSSESHPRRATCERSIELTRGSANAPVYDRT